MKFYKYHSPRSSSNRKQCTISSSTWLNSTMISSLNLTALPATIQNTFKSKSRGKEIKILTESSKESKLQLSTYQVPTSTTALPAAEWVWEIIRASGPKPRFRSNWIKWGCFQNSSPLWCKSPFKKLTEGQNQLKSRRLLFQKVWIKNRFIYMKKISIFCNF